MNNWISTEDELPLYDEHNWRADVIVTVDCDSWRSPKAMCMEWESTTIRGQKVGRFKWNDRLVLSNWRVTHWMYLPEAAPRAAGGKESR